MIGVSHSTLSLQNVQEKRRRQIDAHGSDNLTNIFQLG